MALPAPAYDPMAAQNMVRALAPQQVAGQVLPMTPNTPLSADELYRRILQPGGMQQINRMGGPSAMPSNVVPINPAPTMLGQKFSENQPAPAAQPSWMTQPIRDPRGLFISPSGPMAATGPAQFRNAMRAINVQPTQYNQR